MSYWVNITPAVVSKSVSALGNKLAVNKATRNKDKYL